MKNITTITAAAKRPTLLDIARECGLSRATVARALSGKGYVNPQRRQLIHDTAERLGYRTSAIARALRTQKSATIGVLIADITNPIFPEIVKGIDEAVSVDNYTLFLCNTDEDVAKQRALIRSLLDRQVDGLILISQTVADEALALLQAGPPCVFVNRRPDPLFGDYIGPDNAMGVAQLLEHLYALGHRRMAYVAGPAASSTAQERRACFIREMARLGCPVPEGFIIAGSYQGESGRLAAAALLECAPPPTAILAPNDFVALEIIALLNERGLRVPDDISVTGFDDAFKLGVGGLYALRAQGLTTIDQPKRQLGRLAGEALLKRMAQPGAPFATTLLPTLLAVRDSTAPAKS
ncbi:LacI family DNA-binding transcriptional regulator [Sodalis sp. RH14]|uniref:LacI family DNA-binding transcriptional regulator n=1 Tax=Sodalis sp. RH14 TaxID=3394329 RepID=UPI0039B566C1